jgi:DNA (cytosine-5)-methyltransferase 1
LASSGYLRGELTREQLFTGKVDQGKAAQAEALCARLGKSEADNLDIEDRIDRALKEAKSDDCVLIGGPPCQAYSLVGRARRTNDKEFEADEKHFLYREYLRIVRRFRPMIFVMENVPGLLSAKHSGEKMFELICADLRGAGYSLHPVSPSAEDAAEKPKRYVVRADEFGVPQARARVFVLGLRSDLNLKPAMLVRPERPELNTVADVLADLPRIRSRLSKEKDTVEAWRSAILALKDYRFNNLDHRFKDVLLDRLEILPWTYPLGEPVLDRVKEGPAKLREWYVGDDCDVVLNHNSRGHMRSDLMRYFYWSQYADFYGESPNLAGVPHFLRPAHNNVKGDATDLPFSDRFRVQIGSRPSSTIVSHIAKDGHYYIHYQPKQCRSLSVREAARLQTFPDSYFFESAATDQYWQVGNAVPPYLAMQIASVVRTILAGSSTECARA